MRPACLLLTLAILRSPAWGKYLYADQDVVKEYTGPASAGNFTLSTNNRVVEFYSPYCGHCQQFKATYTEVARAVPDVEFYAVSCVAHNDVCRENEVRAWPSIYTIREGESEKQPWINKGSVGFTAEAVAAAFAFAAPGNGVAAGTDGADKPPRVEAAEREVRDEEEGEDGINGETSPEDDGPDGVGQIDEEEEIDEGQRDRLGGAEDGEGEGRLDEEFERQGDDTEHGDGGDDSDRDAVDTENQDQGNKGGGAEDDDNVDDVDSTVPHQNVQAQERINDAHARFIERKRRIDAALASARKARIERLAKIGYASGPNSRPGTQLAVKDTSEVNRFQSELAQRRREKGKKKLLLARDGAPVSSELQNPPEGATETMKANRVGTNEYKSRRDALIASIRKHRGEARANQVQERLIAAENGLDMHQNSAVSGPAVAFQKQVKKKRIVEKIPILKRMIRMSHEEEIILDASKSFVEGLKSGLFKLRKGLSQDEQLALENWLHLMRVTLPPEWALHNLIDDLLDHFDSVVKSHIFLARVIDRHPLHRQDWSRSCSPPGKVGGGFTCGFWKLLHIMSVGLAEHRGGKHVVKLRMARRDSVLFSPGLAADTVREYIANFFPCTTCTQHFLERYDDCSYRRCTRLSDKVSKSTDSDWKELAKWLWEFHNEVSVRVLHERADDKRKKAQRSTLLRVEQGPGAASVNEEISVLYPSIHDCMSCYNGDGTWNDDAVFVFLEKQYWPSATIDKRTARLLTFEGDSADREFNLTLILLALGMVLLYYLRDSLRKSTFRATLIRARAMRPKGASGSHKRAV